MGAPSAATAGSAGGGEHPACARNAIAKEICQWVAARAEGRQAPKPTYQMVQVFLAQENLTRTTGRIVADTGKPGLYRVTSNNVFGYCLATTETLQVGGLYSTWIRKRPRAESFVLPDGRTESCSVLEDMPIADGIVRLLDMSDGPEAQALAQKTLDAILKFVPGSQQGGAAK